MKKTFTINISGSVFHIEEDAYDVLQRYLIQLKNHFGNSDEGKEIIADIEARIAEIFSEKSKDTRKIITLIWVNEAIEIMGNPEDFGDDETDEDDPYAAETKRKRRLYRDPDHRVIGGVCGGLGAYFNMDPVVLRIIFAILLFVTFPAALLAYLVLWIAVPKAKNTAQRLEMRGQEATVKNIEKSIKEEMREVKESYRKFKESDTYSKGKKGIETAGDVTYSVFKVILKIAVVVFGVLLILTGFFGLIGLVSSMVLGHSFSQGWPLIWTPEIHFPGVLNHFVETGTLTLGMVAIGLLAGIPLLALLFVGTKMVFRYKTNNTAIGLSMVGVWLIALVTLVTLSVGQVSNFKARSSITESVTISCDSCQTLYLKLGDDKYEPYSKMNFEIENYKMVMVDGQEVMLGYPTLDIEKSGSNEFAILIKKAARGRTRETAKNSSEDIVYHYQLNDSTLSFDPYFVLEEEVLWRGQEVEITVRVPENKSVFLSDDMVKIIHDIDNTSNTWDGDMVGKTWIMKPEGLTLKEDQLAPLQP